MATITIKRSWVRERRAFQLASVADLRKAFHKARKQAMRELGRDRERDAILQERVDKLHNDLLAARGF